MTITFPATLVSADLRPTKESEPEVIVKLKAPIDAVDLQALGDLLGAEVTLTLVERVPRP